jgi:hypothetical protein
MEKKGRKRDEETHRLHGADRLHGLEKFANVGQL